MGGTGTPDLGSLAGTGGQPSMLDKATAMLEKNRASANAENDKIRAENKAAREENRAAAARDAATARNTPTGGRPAGRDSSADSTNTDKPRGYRARPTNLDPTYTDNAKPTDAPGAPASQPVAERKEEDVPGFSVLASFEMKSVHQSGTFKIDLNKYTTDNLTLRFDENIGDMRGLKSGDNFRQVNLDDPLYKQRELVVFVDGMNAKDFGDYINFATVQMRKKHQLGDETQDEVRIDRANFNKEGNNFKLLYGWKNDTDRRKWMDYEYQTTWSFFGGKEMQVPWKKANAGAIDLSPPFQKHSVDLQADPDEIAKAGVRAITVKVYYSLGDSEQVKQTTLNIAKGQLSDRIDFILPAGKVDYGYQIDWTLKGNRTATTGRKTANSAVLFVDEVPAG
jgi:hypothetical protein